jgi:hypothetical protein
MAEFRLTDYTLPKSLKHFLSNQVSEFKQLFSVLRYGKEVGFRNVNSMLNAIIAKHGFDKSVIAGLPVDNIGSPLPWYTYPSIEFLKQFDFSDRLVFEYSCGNGSRFWSNRVKSVVSVENDKRWFDKMSVGKYANHKLLFREKQSDYVNAINESNDVYDIIIIDGVFRYKCAQSSLPRLNAAGFIILDNSDWFPKTSALLRKSGLLEVDFTGLGPINYYAWTTSIYFQRTADLKPLDNIQPQHGVASLIQTANPE